MTETRLTDKQRIFVSEYLTCLNASEAARRAGYSETTAGSIGHENLKKPEIQKAIAEQMNAHAMSSAEAVYRLSEMARGTMVDFLDPERSEIDLTRAANAGKLGLIKSYTRTTTEYGGTVRVELYDAQAALVQIINLQRLAAGDPTSRVEMNVRNLPEIPDTTIADILTD
jgi:phage terminase small subunit